jgi:hypothetical protein
LERLGERSKGKQIVLSLVPSDHPSSKLPPPIRPSGLRSDEEDDEYRGSLSDYSEYESSDEGAHTRMTGSSSTKKGYVEDDLGIGKEEDPFADPFADANGVEFIDRHS